jgi:hypothetical protein
MTRTIRSLIPLALILAAAILGAGTYAVSLNTRRSEESLFKRVSTLRIGSTTQEDCQPIFSEYTLLAHDTAPPGRPGEEHYVVAVVNRSLNRSAAHPLLWRLGLRPTAATVDLLFKNDKLASVRYELQTVSSAVNFGARTEIDVVLQLKNGITSATDPSYYVGYGVRPSIFVPQAKQFGLGAILTPTATNNNRKDALDLDFSCLSAFRGCRAPCQLLPAVWTELKRRSSRNEIDLPAEILEDPSCPGS